MELPNQKPEMAYYDEQLNQIYHIVYSPSFGSYETWVYDETGCISYGFLGGTRLVELCDKNKLKFIGVL